MKKNDDWRWKRAAKEWRKTQSRYKWVLGPRTAQLIVEKEQKKKMEDKWLEREIELLRKQNCENNKNNAFLFQENGRIIDFFEEVAEAALRKDISMNQISLYLSRIREMFPLTPLTGNEDEWDEWRDWDSYGKIPKKHRGNLRYSDLIQHEDGTLVDYGRVVYVSENGGHPQWTPTPDEIMAKLPSIKFPYFPTIREYRIYGSDFCLDRKGNGTTDKSPGKYNLRYYHYMENSKGNRTELNLWYVEGEDGRWRKMEAK